MHLTCIRTQNHFVDTSIKNVIIETCIPILLCIYDTKPKRARRLTRVRYLVKDNFAHMCHILCVTKIKWCSIFYMGSTRSVDRSVRKIINISIWTAWGRSSVPAKKNNVNPIWEKERHVIQIGCARFEPPCLQNKRLRKAVKYDLVHHNFYDLIKRT